MASRFSIVSHGIGIKKERPCLFKAAVLESEVTSFLFILYHSNAEPNCSFWA